VIEDGDDAAILQRNGRSSELSICCKRGHSAILPSFLLAMYDLPKEKKSLILRAERGRSAARDCSGCGAALVLVAAASAPQDVKARIARTG
jgi:hypothetical protein